MVIDQLVARRCDTPEDISVAEPRSREQCFVDDPIEHRARTQTTKASADSERFKRHSARHRQFDNGTVHRAAAKDFAIGENQTTAAPVQPMVIRRLDCPVERWGPC